MKTALIHSATGTITTTGRFTTTVKMTSMIEVLLDAHPSNRSLSLMAKRILGGFMSSGTDNTHRGLHFLNALLRVKERNLDRVGEVFISRFPARVIRRWRKYKPVISMF